MRLFYLHFIKEWTLRHRDGWPKALDPEYPGAGIHQSDHRNCTIQSGARWIPGSSLLGIPHLSNEVPISTYFLFASSVLTSTEEPRSLLAGVQGPPHTLPFTGFLALSCHLTLLGPSFQWYNEKLVFIHLTRYSGASSLCLAVMVNT